MATKAQKRAAGLAQHEKDMAELAADGLRAQKLDQIIQGEAAEKIRFDSEQEAARLEKILEDSIIEKATDFGKKVRSFEHNASARTHIRQRWAEFLRGLEGSPHHATALIAYHSAFVGDGFNQQPYEDDRPMHGAF